MTQLKGRVAIVTGGGRGLGRAMVLGLAQAGAYVVATAARERAELEAVAREAQQSCGEARVLPSLADVTQEDDCSQIVETAIRHFGRLDILVNNAGRGMKYVSNEFLTEPTRFWEVAPQTWHMVIDTNVNGPFMMARSAVPVMLKAGWGRIVNVSMNHETMRRRGFSPYGRSKAALESETVIWSKDLARHRSDRECASARRSHPHRNDSRRCAGRSTISVTRSCNRGTTATLAGFAGFRRDDWPTAGSNKMAN